MENDKEGKLMNKIMISQFLTEILIGGFANDHDEFHLQKSSV